MTNFSKSGGILTIIGGVFSIFYLFMGLIYMLLPTLVNSAIMNAPTTKGNTNLPPEAMLFFIIFGSVICLFAVAAGVLSITGGVFCLKRKRWGLALAGAITSTLLFFPIGVIAVVLISRGHAEFSEQPVPNSSSEIDQIAH